MTEVQTNGGKQQRKRDGERNDESAANIPQEQKENDHHQDDALGQIVQNGVRGVMQQIASVEERNDLHSRGKDLIVEFFYLGVDSHQGGVGVIPFLEKDDALDHVVVVDHLAIHTVDGLAYLAQANFRALHYR